MGSLQPLKKPKHGGRPPGKIDASLNEKLSKVKWGEYKILNLFTEQKIKKKLSKNDLSNKFNFPAYSAESANNGIIGYTDNPEFICDETIPTYVIFGDHTRMMNIATKSFSVLDNVKVLKPCVSNVGALLFIFAAWQKQIPNLGYARHWKLAKNCMIKLPIKDSKIDFDFMESFIAELEAERIAELSAYLKVSGLDNYELSNDEKLALENYTLLKWEVFNLKKLFGKSTRGKRLKSDDRIAGTLPFVTAGESAEGISAYISNNVEVFEKNTTTIDMFGSAKYRNYKYGADDHIAVVHTENVPMEASIFITSAIHKAAHTGRFDYGRNFYAKDADALDILLPVKDGKPDYQTMETLISAIQKLVIKDVAIYSQTKISAAKKITER